MTDFDNTNWALSPDGPGFADQDEMHYDAPADWLWHKHT